MKKMKVLTMLGIFSFATCTYAEDLKFPVVTPNDLPLVEKLNFGNKTLGNVVLNKTNKTPPGSVITVPGNENNGWNFILGPTGSPNMVLKFNKVQSQASIIFTCEKNTGREQLAMVLYGLEKPVGTKIDLTTTIGLTTHVLPVEVTENDVKDKISFLGVDGDAVPELLEAMAETDIPLMEESVTINDLNGHMVKLGLPIKKDVAFNSANICRTWKLDAEKNKQLQGHDKNDYGGDVHIPKQNH